MRRRSIRLCIDEHADSWTCGIEARDQLTKLIGGRQVRCDDLGVDPAYKKRHLGVCKIEGETTSLSQLLVGKGFALNVEPPQRAFQGGRGPRQRRSSGAVERLLRGAGRVPPSARRTAPCSADRAGPTGTARSATRCSPTISPCRPAAASRASTPSAPASPAISASTICRPAALPGADQTGSLVLFRGGRAGRRVPQSL